MRTLITLAFIMSLNIDNTSAQNCETPKPTEWQNYYVNDTTKSRMSATYYIQFLSVRHENTVPVPFDNYIIVKDGCFRRFYVDIQFENLEAALNYLPNVKQYYKDAFPIIKNFKPQ